MGCWKRKNSTVRKITNFLRILAQRVNSTIDTTTGKVVETRAEAHK